jgi:hypothetical protein
MKFAIIFCLMLLGISAWGGPPIVWKGADAQLLNSGDLLDASGTPIGGVAGPVTTTSGAIVIWNSADGSLTANSDLLITGGQLLFNDGSAGTPGFGFDSCTNCGWWYDTGSSEMRATIGGSTKVRINTASVEMNGTVFLPIAGTEALPGIAYPGDLGTGIYRIAAGNIGFSTSGVKRLGISSTGLNMDSPITFDTTNLHPIGSSTFYPMSVYTGGFFAEVPSSGFNLQAAGVNVARWRTNVVAPNGVNSGIIEWLRESDGQMAVFTQSQTGATDSIDLFLGTGNVVDGAAGDMFFRPGRESGTGSNGLLGLQSDRTEFFIDQAMFISDAYVQNWWGDFLEGVYCDSAVLDAINQACGFFSTDSAVDAVGTADVYFKSGDQTATTASDKSGDAGIFSGDVTSATSTAGSGTINVESGSVSGSGASGSVVIRPGSVNSGVRGDVRLGSKVAFTDEFLASLTADDQVVTVINSRIEISSNSATPTDRTFTISNGTSDGQLLFIYNGSTNQAELADSGNVRLAGTMTFNGIDDSIMLLWNSSKWLEISRSDN